MDGKIKFIIKGIYLFLLIIGVEILVFIKDDVFMWIPWWVIPSVAFALSVSAGWFLYSELVKNYKEKNLFIEIATHKFRTPISVIGWSADSLESSIDITARREEVKKIRSSLNKLKEIIDTLVGVTEMNESVFYHFSPLDIRKMFEDVLSENIKKELEDKKIKLFLNFKGETPVIYADHKKISFVFKNLIENAILYTKEGGQIELGLKENKNSVILSIKDSGIGIKREDIRYIFNDFYRAGEAKKSDTEGMGLGLYVSKKIVEKHGGKIWVESAGENKGSTFFVEFKMDKYRQIS